MSPASGHGSAVEPGSGSVARGAGVAVVVNTGLDTELGHISALVATADAFADQGVQFVGIAYQDDPLDSLTFLDELGLSATTEYVVDEGSRAAIAFGNRCSAGRCAKTAVSAVAS